MEEIHSEFGLTFHYKNIIATVTDNGSNFVKAFKEFNISVVADEDENDDTEDFLVDTKFMGC